MIDSKANSLNDLKPSEDLIKEIGDLKRNRNVLDFGCGVGRNIVGMAKMAPNWRIVGYDNKAMILEAVKYVFDAGVGESTNVSAFDEWEKVVALSSVDKFDTIFCCFALQHIPEDQLRWYLSQFPQIGNEIFVYGRRALDPSNTIGYDGGKSFVSVWDVILSSEYEIIDAQDGFMNVNDNGNDHYWVKFKSKETNVRRDKRKR